MVVVKGYRHAVKVRGRSQQHEAVEDLMRATPDIELARETPFRPAYLLGVSRVSIEGRGRGVIPRRERHQRCTELPVE